MPARSSSPCASPTAAAPRATRPTQDEDLYIYDRLGIGGTTIFEPSADCILEDHPTFSPDGEKIAYESEVTNGSGQKDILIANADGSGTPVNFTNTSMIVEETPVWSPDGEFIYYARRTTAAGESDIYRHPADGGTALPIIGLMSATNEFQPEISPNGKRLCYTFGAFGAPAADVMVASVNGAGDPFELSPNDTNVADYDCGWSPNGKRIAWTRGAFGSGELQFSPRDRRLHADAVREQLRNLRRQRRLGAASPGCAMGSTRRSPAIPVTTTSSAPPART